MADCLLRSLNKTEFTFDETTLTKYPLEENQVFYRSLARTVTKLILIRINKEKIDPLFEIFKNVSHLTLEDVFIANDLDEFPTRLQTLELKNTIIHRVSLSNWFKRLQGTLRTIKLTNSLTDLDSICFNNAMAYWLYFLPQLKEISVENNNMMLDFSDDNRWEKLEVFTNSLKMFGALPHIKHLRLEAIQHVHNNLKGFGPMPHLETLILSNPPPNLDCLRNYKLKCLEIINPVASEETFNFLHSLPNVENVKVHYIQPLGENELFRLDNDSLSKVFSHLDLNDWIALMEVSPRFSDIVCYDIMPRTALKIDGKFMKRFPYKRKCRDLYETLGEHAKWVHFTGNNEFGVLFHMKQLKRLYLKMERTKANTDITKYIPEGIEQLGLRGLFGKTPINVSFKPFSKSLTSLSLHCSLVINDLAELHNLRKLEIMHRCVPYIDISELLENNKDHLEVIQIQFAEHYFKYDLNEYQLAARTIRHKTFNFAPMQYLRELHLTEMIAPVELKQDFFPSLKVLRVTFVSKIPQAAFDGLFKDLLNLKTLERLEINNIPDIQQLSRLQWLRTLEIRDNEVFHEVLLLIAKMPHLVELGLFMNPCSDVLVCLCRQLLELLQGRTLRLYKWGAAESKFCKSIWFEEGTFKFQTKAERNKTMNR